ncbi:hypothetical protein PQY04_003336 [Salmonella enterica]|nr:hypothetical protein [Salmonella enterica]EFO5656785.1 hypothetical protein [Salmonella enterica subsp. houtenae serovar 50:z4,z23:-]EEC6815376.1 hypothetical protein [Salmonella enterica]EEH3633056.1 hypothetical protein [Salmonella enterica]EEL0897264.1 hypothetical protein [Salmonella enterica]
MNTLVYEKQSSFLIPVLYRLRLTLYNCAQCALIRVAGLPEKSVFAHDGKYEQAGHKDNEK